MEKYMENYNGRLSEPERKELLNKAEENVSNFIDKVNFLKDQDKEFLKVWMKDDFPSLDDFSLKIMGKPDTVNAYFELVNETSEDKFSDIASFIACMDAAEFLNDEIEEYPLEWEIINAKIKSEHEKNNKEESEPDKDNSER